MMKKIEITKEQAKKMHESRVERLMSIAESDFPELLKSKKEAEMVLAICQLVQLRDKANGEPLFDWCDWRNNTETKPVIISLEGEISTTARPTFSTPLVFKTDEIRDQFLKDHKTLIKKAFGLC